MDRTLVYLTTDEDGRHILNVVAAGKFCQFEIDKTSIARLNVECAERLLKWVPGAYANRFKADPIVYIEGELDLGLSQIDYGSPQAGD